MKLFFHVILAILVFLAISSGFTKISLMPQDVEFFGQYGFSNPILIFYGLCQLLGGILLLIPKTRVIGAIVVAISFIVSAVVLAMAGQYLLFGITLLCVVLLAVITKRTINAG